MRLGASSVTTNVLCICSTAQPLSAGIVSTKTRCSTPSSSQFEDVSSSSSNETVSNTEMEQSLEFGPSRPKRLV